jgi:hypothetical protein
MCARDDYWEVEVIHRQESEMWLILVLRYRTHPYYQI